MAAPNEIRVASAGEFVEAVEQLVSSADRRMLWYRGSSDATYDLVPSLYRHPDGLEVAELLKKEREKVAVLEGGNLAPRIEREVLVRRPAVLVALDSNELIRHADLRERRVRRHRRGAR